jgi:hypothetical protein
MKIFLKASVLAAMAWSHCLADESQEQLRRRTDESEADEDLGLDHFGFESRIVGGTVASGSDYPFIVNLGGCGGSL